MLAKVHTFIAKNGLQTDNKKWRPPYEMKYGKPMYDTRGISDDKKVTDSVVANGLLLFQRIAPQGEQPKTAPFNEKGEATFDTAGFSDKQIE